MKTRVLSYEKTIEQWTSIEEDIIEKIHKKKRKLIRKKTEKNSNKIKSFFEIPKKIKIYFIRKVLRNQTKNYINLLNIYNEECEKIDEINRKRKWQIECLKEKPDAYPFRPKKLFFRNIFTSDKIVEVISKVEQKRLEWENILATEDWKIKRSYLR